jgi:hypothetical protein
MEKIVYEVESKSAYQTVQRTIFQKRLSFETDLSFEFIFSDKTLII